MTLRKLSIAAARRIAIAAQGLDRARPARPDCGHIRRTINQLGLLQLDFVNVLVPAHQLIIYSRLGAYDRRRFAQTVYDSGDFIEHWAHEASIVPIQHWPLLEYRRKTYQSYPGGSLSKLRNKARYLADTLELVENYGGPITANDLPAMPGPKRKAGDWHRSMPRIALEYHFGKGNLTVVNRLPNFQRVYDLPRNVIPAQYRSQSMTDEEAHRKLLLIAVAAHGIGTGRDLGDYFRMPYKNVAPRLLELEQEGSIRRVTVAGWSEDAFMAQNARVPRSVSCAAILSPFDPLVWFRPRAQRLFDFHYRIEIYVPAHKRKWGYYVLPFLLDERIVARVDIKADRKNSKLLILACHEEKDIDQERVIRKLAVELRSLAAWLDLAAIKVSRRGKFARGLADCMKGDPHAA